MGISALVLYVDDLRTWQQGVEDSEVDQEYMIACKELENYDWFREIKKDELVRINQIRASYGFTIVIEIANEESLDGTEIDFADFSKFVHDDGMPHMYAVEELTFVTFRPEGATYNVYAIETAYLNGTGSFKSYSRYIFNTLLIIGSFIITLCIVSFYFTRRLSRHIMEPLSKLIKISKNIQNKNSNEEIIYLGNWEFENVCNSMNDMQHTIKENEEQKERYEQSRRDMIAGISHDLRTPLTAIRGTIKGLQDGGCDA